MPSPAPSPAADRTTAQTVGDVLGERARLLEVAERMVGRLPPSEHRAHLVRVLALQRLVEPSLDETPLALECARDLRDLAAAIGDEARRFSRPDGG